MRHAEPTNLDPDDGLPVWDAARLLAMQRALQPVGIKTVEPKGMFVVTWIPEE